MRTPDPTRMRLVARRWRVVGSRPGTASWTEVPETAYTEEWIRGNAAKYFPGEPLEYEETWVTEFMPDKGGQS